jgi:hypothetical protein
MTWLSNPIRQPSLDISPIWTPLSAMRLLTHREDLYDMIDSSCVFVGFSYECSGFYSTDGASGRHYKFSQILPLLLCIGVHGLGLLARFAA